MKKLYNLSLYYNNTDNFLSIILLEISIIYFLHIKFNYKIRPKYLGLILIFFRLFIFLSSYYFTMIPNII